METLKKINIINKSDLIQSIKDKINTDMYDEYQEPITLSKVFEGTYSKITKFNCNTVTVEEYINYNYIGYYKIKYELLSYDILNIILNKIK